MWQRIVGIILLAGPLMATPFPPGDAPHLQDIGGPDNFGHYWKDSKNACAASFFYLDPTSAGSMLAGEERSYVHIRLPFTVTFYGVDYDSIWITTEGFATFNTQGLLDWSNSEIPSTASSEPNNAFYVYWDDLDLRDYGRVDTGTFLVNGSRVFVIEWDSVEHYNYKGQGTFTFELQIYEAAPDSFGFAYLVTNAGTAGADSAKSATVGMENTDGTDGLQYSYNTPAIPDSTMIVWTLHPFWVGGPDAFGHYCVHSNQSGWTPPTDLDPPAAGSMLAGQERSYQQVDLPFPVIFYGDTFTSLYVTTEGFVTFSDEGLLDWDNGPIPDPTSGKPNNALYVYWDDLNLQENGRVDTATFGTVGHRIFVIEWDSVGAYVPGGGSAGAFTFEIQFYESPIGPFCADSFAFVYEVVDGGTSFADSGKSATIGIENADGTDGLQASYNRAFIGDGQAILWMARFPTRVSEGQQPPVAPVLRVLSMGPSARAVFTLPQPAPVSLDLFDQAGRRVQVLALGTLGAGTHTVRIPTRSLPSGVYFLRLRTGTTARTVRFLNLR